jgi:hypothetical protein
VGKFASRVRDSDRKTLLVNGEKMIEITCPGLTDVKAHVLIVGLLASYLSAKGRRFSAIWDAAAVSPAEK